MSTIVRNGCGKPTGVTSPYGFCILSRSMRTSPNSSTLSFGTLAGPIYGAKPQGRRG